MRNTTDVIDQTVSAAGELRHVDQLQLTIKTKRKAMNKIDSIIIHCSATRAGQDLTAKDIDRMHRARGFNQIGYNYVIRLTGRTVIRKVLANHLTINIVSVFAISAAWMQMESPQIHGRHRKRQHCGS